MLLQGALSKSWQNLRSKQKRALNGPQKRRPGHCSCISSRRACPSGSPFGSLGHNKQGYTSLAAACYRQGPIRWHWDVLLNICIDVLTSTGSATISMALPPGQPPSIIHPAHQPPGPSRDGAASAPRTLLKSTHDGPQPESNLRKEVDKLKRPSLQHHLAEPWQPYREARYEPAAPHRSHFSGSDEATSLCIACRTHGCL